MARPKTRTQARALRAGRPLHRCITAELAAFGRPVGWVEWRPHRARCDGIHANAFVTRLVASERVKAWMPPLVVE